MYKETGWHNFDKIKNYDQAVKYYERGREADPNWDVTQIGHQLAHSYERAGRLDDAEKAWEENIKRHEAIIADPKSKPEEKGRNTQGLNSSKTNLAILKIRRAVRPEDTQPQYETNFTARIVRVKPKFWKFPVRLMSLGPKTARSTWTKALLCRGRATACVWKLVFRTPGT